MILNKWITIHRFCKQNSLIYFTILSIKLNKVILLFNIFLHINIKILLLKILILKAQDCDKKYIK